MENTTDDLALTASEIRTIQTHEADQDWANEAQSRIAHAEALLDRISNNIETVPAQNREHAADLLDTTIDLLQRINHRFSPDPTKSPTQDPPF